MFSLPKDEMTRLVVLPPTNRFKDLDRSQKHSTVCMIVDIMYNANMLYVVDILSTKLELEL